VTGVATALVVAALAWRGVAPSRVEESSAVGGPFQLVDQTGRRVDERILKGKWTAVFFGYTFCPDVCPTTLTTLGGAMQALGAKARDVRVVFITVDPGRDTPAQLRAYLTSPTFPKGVVGLTGSEAQIAAAARAWRVYYKRVPDGATYSMDHTSIVYLMDPRGRFSRPLDMSVPPAGVARQITDAIDGA
jgi:protein SCO1/2